MDARLVRFGANIRRIRKRKGVSQEDLANLSGIGRSHMGRIERGEANITVSTLLKVSDTLVVAPAAFFEDM